MNFGLNVKTIILIKNNIFLARREFSRNYNLILARLLKNCILASYLERCSSGLRGTPGKRVYVKSVPRVRIPLSPHEY